MDLAPEQIKLYCVCPIPVGMFANAKLLMEKGNNLKVIAKNGLLIHYVFNASGFMMQRLNITGVPVTLRRFKNETNATQTTLHLVTDCMKPDEAEEYDDGMMEA